MLARKRPRLDGDEDGEVEAVLADELLQPVPPVDAYVGVVSDRKCLSRLIRALSEAHPVPRLHHLKRVRRDEILLALCDEFPSGEACLKALAAKGWPPAQEGLTGEVRTKGVPGRTPVTRRQWDAANATWPCSFHEDAALERLLAGTMFAPEERRVQCRWMADAIDAARRAGVRGAELVGAVVVDPKRGAVVAVARDARNEHPLRHAAMNAVDLVAHSQLGGAWPVLDDDYFDADVPGKPPPVGTPRNSDDQAKEGPYLCTGYDVYLSREPCSMCAMALVHSRARRVFYAAPSPDGVLGTREKLHAVRALNHHYQVFRGPLRNAVL